MPARFLTPGMEATYGRFDSPLTSAERVQCPVPAPRLRESVATLASGARKRLLPDDGLSDPLELAEVHHVVSGVEGDHVP